MRENSVTFTVEGTLPPSMNRLLRMHWAKRRRLAEEFGFLIIAAVKLSDVRCLKAWAGLGLKVRVRIEVSTPKLYDEDGLSALAKFPLDFFVAKRWLKDDSPEHLEFAKPIQRIGKKSITFKIESVARVLEA